jgi:TPR repeat protein
VELNRALESVRNLREVIWLKGRAGRYADALPDMNRALELDPEDAWVRSRRAIALFTLERHADAYKDFLVGAQKGDAFAQNKVGWYLMMGVGVPQNKREGAQWFAKAAAGGDKDGINNLKQAKAEGSI